MTYMGTQYRQGDILLILTDLTLGDVLSKGGVLGRMSKIGPILALGEVTGHHHTALAHPEDYSPQDDLPVTYVPDLGMSLAEYGEKMLRESSLHRLSSYDFTQPACRLYDVPDDSSRYLVVTRTTLLRHDEHAPLELCHGVWKVIQQMEYSPKGWLPVVD